EHAQRECAQPQAKQQERVSHRAETLSQPRPAGRRRSRLVVQEVLHPRREHIKKRSGERRPNKDERAEEQREQQYERDQAEDDIARRSVPCLGSGPQQAKPRLIVVHDEEEGSEIQEHVEKQRSGSHHQQATVTEQEEAAMERQQKAGEEL